MLMSVVSFIPHPPFRALCNDAQLGRYQRLTCDETHCLLEQQK